MTYWNILLYYLRFFLFAPLLLVSYFLFIHIFLYLSIVKLFFSISKILTKWRKKWIRQAERKGQSTCFRSVNQDFNVAHSIHAQIQGYIPVLFLKKKKVKIQTHKIFQKMQEEFLELRKTKSLVIEIGHKTSCYCKVTQHNNYWKEQPMWSLYFQSSFLIRCYQINVAL